MRFFFEDGNGKVYVTEEDTDSLDLHMITVTDEDVLEVIKADPKLNEAYRDHFCIGLNDKPETLEHLDLMEVFFGQVAEHIQSVIRDSVKIQAFVEGWQT